MSYRRIETQDGKTVMNKELYDNLQDGIEEALEKGSVTTECTTIEEFVLTEEATTIKKGVTVLIGEVQYILVAEDGTNANNYIAVGATPDNIVLSEDYADPEVAQEEFNGFPEREDVISGYENTIAFLKEELENRPTKAQINNPNLLDNPWFTVNQRGQNEYSGIDKYCVDRWILGYWETENDSITVHDNGVTLSDDFRLVQLLNEGLKKGIYTLSVLFNENPTVEGLNVTLPGNKWATDYLVDSRVVNNISYISFEVQNDVDKDDAKVWLSSHIGMNIRAVKLEKGSISTLSMDIAPNYALELIKCSMSKADTSDTYANKTLTFN